MLSPQTSSGLKGGGALVGSVVLDPWVQEMENCSKCGGPEIVIYAWEFAEGRLGVCLGCGQPKKAPFTRTMEKVVA